jgi:hypothetical protein
MARTVYSRVRARSAALLALIIAVGLLPASSIRSTEADGGMSDVILKSAGTASVLYQSNDGVACRDATTVEIETLVASGEEVPLHTISPVQTMDQNGLTIILRATDALENNAQAKAAFVRVASLYQSMISSPITVVVNVDFAPTWFGQEYPEGVAGLTNPQLLMGNPIYPLLQQHLIDGASSAEERDLYYALPQIAVTTDLGDTRTVVGPSALFRALEFINSVAAPEIEPVIWGPPPAIGFNSNVPYDFDPTDGVDEGKADFEAAVSHEIGHVLGFVSYAGVFELDPEQPCALSVWDLFRLRPGVSMNTFPTADRILSSGGAQVYFAGGLQYPLSTARPDGTGGDGNQASHWKDDAFTGDRIGIMDPSFPQGRRQTVTLKDLAALNIFGYSVRPIGNTKPGITELEADLNGDILSVRATLIDVDLDPSRVQLTLINEADQVVSQIAPVAEDFGLASKTLFRKDYPGMSSVPAVTQVGLIVSDTRGNFSTTAIVDFSKADPGGPKLSDGNYKGGRLSLKGKKFGNQPQIEINGQIVAPVETIEIAGSKKKLVIEADSSLLNLRPGANRVRIISGGLRSNLLVMDL